MIYLIPLQDSEILFDADRRRIARISNRARGFSYPWSISHNTEVSPRAGRANDLPVKVTFVFDGLSVPALDGVTSRAVAAIKHLAADQRIALQVVQGIRDQDCSGWLNQLGVELINIEGQNLYKDDISKVVALIKQFGPHIIHTGNSHSVVQHFGRRLADATGAALVADVHDIDEHLLSSLNKDQSQISEFIETQIISSRLTDYTVAISPVDHAYLLKNSLTTADTTALIPNGTTPVKPRSPALLTPNAPRILFIGNCFYEPNAQAVKYIQNSLAPAVSSVFPQAKFLIAGRCPNELARSTDESVCYLGVVDDLETLAAQCSLAIAPLTAGSGLKVKVLTYAGLSIPMVISPVAASGFPRDMYHDIAEPGPFFERAVIGALLDSSNLEQSARKTLAFVDSHYSWNNLFNNLVEKYLVWSEDAPSKNDKPAKRRRVNLTEHNSQDIYWDDTIALPLWLREKRFTNNTK